MTHPEHRPTDFEYLTAELKNQMGPHQPKISGKRNFLTQFRKDVQERFKNGKITPTEKEQLLQVAQKEQEKLEREESERKAQEEAKLGNS